MKFKFADFKFAGLPRSPLLCLQSMWLVIVIGKRVKQARYFQGCAGTLHVSESALALSI